MKTSVTVRIKRSEIIIINQQPYIQCSISQEKY